MDLSSLNPWWNLESANEVKKADADLRRVEAAELDYWPEPFSDEDLSQANIYTLRGARRVGKTVALKLLILRRLSIGIPGRSIVWTTAETIRRFDLLESHLENLVKTLKAMGAVNSPAPPLLIVDEITSVRGWQKVIKKLRDTGILEGYCMILTGSSAHDLKVGAEKMAGRRGISSHLDRVLLPMTYPQFRLQLKGLIPETEILAVYFRCGGFPFRVSEFKKEIGKGKNPDNFLGMNVFEEIIFYEIERRKLERTISIDVIERLSVLGASGASYDGFAKPLSSTKETIRKHLNAFGDAFLLATFASFDLARGRLAPKKERKFCWIDPAIRYFSQYLGRGHGVDDAVVAEGLVALELCRRYERRLYEGLNSLNAVNTWKSDRGGVDFMIQDRTSGKLSIWPVEVKFQSSISEWDWKLMAKVFGRGTLVTRFPYQGEPPEKIRVIDLETLLIRQGDGALI